MRIVSLLYSVAARHSGNSSRAATDSPDFAQFAEEIISPGDDPEANECTRQKDVIDCLTVLHVQHPTSGRSQALR